MVAHNWALSRGEGVGLGPTQTYTDTQLTNLGTLVFAPWVAGHIETRNTQTSSGTWDSHDTVQHCRWLLMRASTVTTCLKADTVYGCIYFMFTDDLGDHIRQLSLLREIDGFTAKTASLCESISVHITNDNHGRAEQLTRNCTSQSDGSSACDIDSRSRCHTGGECPMVSGWEDVREHGQIKDLLHGLVLVGEF